MNESNAGTSRTDRQTDRQNCYIKTINDNYLYSTEI